MTEQQDTSAVLPAEGFVRLPLILSLIPVSKSTWWSGCKSGRFPAPVKLGPRTTAWKVSDIRALIDQGKTGTSTPAESTCS